jgi:RNA polymerase sigma-70 factor (ECF subfamily)
MASFARDLVLSPSPLDAESLEALARRAKTRDTQGYAAFETLFHYFNSPICDYLAYLLHNVELAHDLAQDTFFAAWQALPETRDELHVRAWFFRIATNKAYSYLRRQKILTILSVEGFTATLLGREAEPDILPGLCTPGPEEQVAQAELVRETLRLLSPKYRTCVLLQDQAGFSQREIAQILRISEKTVSAYVSRGRQQFLQFYQRLECEEDDQPGSKKKRGRKPKRTSNS